MASLGRQEARRGLLVGNDGRRSFIGLSAPLDKEENFATPSVEFREKSIIEPPRPPRDIFREYLDTLVLPDGAIFGEREILVEVHARFMHILISATAVHSTALRARSEREEAVRRIRREPIRAER